MQVHCIVQVFGWQVSRCTGAQVRKCEARCNIKSAGAQMCRCPLLTIDLCTASQVPRYLGVKGGLHKVRGGHLHETGRETGGGGRGVEQVGGPRKGVTVFRRL